MGYEFKLPDLGEGLTEGEIARWLVSEGQEIAEDDPLVEIATDKTTVEIPSPAAGVVSRILIREGEIVPVGTVLVVIGGNGAVADEPARTASGPQQPAVSPRAREDKVRATPLANPEHASQGCVEAELSRPDNGAASGIAPLADGRQSKRREVEGLARRRVAHR